MCVTDLVLFIEVKTSLISTIKHTKQKRND